VGEIPKEKNVGKNAGGMQKVANRDAKQFDKHNNKDT
jgi:hypothetical protein